MRNAGRFACPACGTPITSGQFFKPSDYAFPCSRCGARLNKRLRAALPGIASFLLLLWAWDHYSLSWQFGAIALASVAAIALVAFVFGGVRRAPPDMLDASVATGLGRNGGGGSNSSSYGDDSSGGGDGGD